MKITKEEVKRVAQLARLELTGEELGTFGGQLSDVLTYFGKLNEADTDGVDPMSHAVEVVNVFREDRTGPTLGVEDALANAPLREDDHFKAPRTLG